MPRLQLVVPCITLLVVTKAHWSLALMFIEKVNLKVIPCPFNPNLYLIVKISIENPPCALLICKVCIYIQFFTFSTVSKRFLKTYPHIQPWWLGGKASLHKKCLYYYVITEEGVSQLIIKH